jgi:RNA polymerase sigma-70 factor (ECF subfamily)
MRESAGSAHPLPGQISDALLAARAQDGDPDAFQELVRRHASLMRAYVFRIVGSMSEADDVVQNAFLAAWRQLGALRDPSAVRAWLMKIAGREAYAFVKRRPGHAALSDVDPPQTADTQPERVAIRNAQLQALSGALDNLPEDQRRCWLLREVVSLSYAEIAEEMDVSASTVRGLLARARTSIMIQMEGWR